MTSPITTLSDFYTQSQIYVTWFNAFAKKHALVTKARADHICYKCDSATLFESIRSLFEKEAGYIYQTIIAKRRIAIIKLPRPLETALGPIHFLELSDQKPDGSQTNHFDHIKVYPTTFTYEALVTQLEKTETIIKVDRPHHPTHDIDIQAGFLFRCTREPLIIKIKREELK